MASNSSNPLIEVNFQDLTNYITVSDGSDIVGIVADTNWGPVGVPTVCNSSTYRTLFNPQGLGRLNASLATATRIFEMGASYVEVVRLGKSEAGGSEPWVFFTISADMATPEGETTPKATGSVSLNINTNNTYSDDTECLDFSNSSLKGLSDAKVAFRLRYPGGFPMRVSLTQGKSFMGKQLFTLTLSAYTGQDYTTTNGTVESVRSYNSVLETLSFTLEPLEANGVSYFYADQIANNSIYLTADTVWANDQDRGIKGATSVNATAYTQDVATYDIYQLGTPTDDSNLAPKYNAVDFVAGYNVFTDRDTSSSTLLVSSFIPDDDSADSTEKLNYQSVLKAMSTVSEKRKDCNSLLGFPTSSDPAWWGSKGTLDTDVKDNAEKWFTDAGNSGLNMFSSGIVGWETYTLRTTLGVKRFNLDCTAAWAGRICATAYALHNRNQLPSYKAYGSFSGSLVRTLGFDTVVAMHDEDGIGSVYSSAVGNYIFCIRDLYGAGESYFARLNVMRVTAALLSQTFDMVEEVIHTDVAANRTNRLALEGRLNTLLGNFAARQELKVESYANVGDELNSDVNTNGGRYLRIQLVCYFMSLTEKVFITVVARDGSVSADVSMSA